MTIEKIDINIRSDNLPELLYYDNCSLSRTCPVSMAVKEQLEKLLSKDVTVNTSAWMCSYYINDIRLDREIFFVKTPEEIRSWTRWYDATLTEIGNQIKDKELEYSNFSGLGAALDLIHKQDYRVRDYLVARINPLKYTLILNTPDGGNVDETKSSDRV